MENTFVIVRTIEGDVVFARMIELNSEGLLIHDLSTLEGTERKYIIPMSYITGLDVVEPKGWFRNALFTVLGVYEWVFAYVLGYTVCTLWADTLLSWIDIGLASVFVVSAAVSHSLLKKLYEFVMLKQYYSN